MLKKLLMGLLALVLVAGVVLYIYLDAVVKRSIEYMGPQVLGTAVTVDSVDISPFSGKGNIEGLLVSNPDGFSSPYIFELGGLELELVVDSVFSEVVEITSITINSPVITYENRLTTDNIRTLLNQLPQEDAAAPEGAEEEAAAKRVIIHDLKIVDPRVNLSAANLTAPIPLPDISLQNIGEENASVTLAEALRQVLAAVSRTLLTANFEQLREGVEQQVEEQLQRGADAVKETTENLRDLLGR